MKDRFNLEDEINTLYSFSDQLGTLSEGILEHDLSNDDIINVIEGLRIMINLQATKLHDTMCQCFNLGNYRQNNGVAY